jgi:anti-sigma factor RsiW
MDCCEFRERYSDFADGLLEEEGELRARRHLGACAACRRFDAAFRAGVGALRELPSVEVSRSFGDRLRRRIRHELTVRTLAVSPLSGTIAALLVMVTIGFVAWDLAELRGAKHPAAAPVARAPMRVRTPAPVVIHLDTAWIFATGFHPFDPALLVADTNAPLDLNPQRFDIPAVWGGR